MAKSQKGSQPPKKTNTGGSLGDLHSGSMQNHPGILKAQADKRKANANLAAYKQKSDEVKKSATEALKKKTQAAAEARKKK